MTLKNRWEQECDTGAKDKKRIDSKAVRIPFDCIGNSLVPQDSAELPKSFSKLFSIVADSSGSCKDQSRLKRFSTLIERISLAFRKGILKNSLESLITGGSVGH
ncbi:hypothetical protein VNO77_42226 [Canavalia gladiata]|uniref:Uncharacterized protein n=1 Tax=Canavalia gladiata TaxID=3824 RepID=A0AAN9JCF9_CANGL